MTFSIRPALETDIPEITSLYRDHVLYGLASFETDPPDEEEMLLRFNKIKAANCPYLVAQEDDKIVGYSYASLFHTRWAYRLTVENSIYIDMDCLGRGIGSALMAALIKETEKAGFRQMIAVITRLDTPASVHLHEKFGFQTQGILERVGHKNGHWLDVIYMQRALGEGGNTQPNE